MSTTPRPFSDPELSAFMQQFERAIEEFINGNNQPWLALASRRDDATIMGSWGAYERGWTEVGRRYDWAASQFRPSGAKVRVEYLASGASDDLAYTVAVERAEPLIVGQERRPQELRVTHVFRKEDGKWRFVHRQADPLIAKKTPEGALRS
jgi:ketosteroid isomerase-like protein